MSFFNTTATLRHATPLPAGADKAQAVAALLHDHDFFISCGPHTVEVEPVPAAEAAELAATARASDASGEHPLPAAVRDLLEKDGLKDDAGRYAVYRVTDVVHTLPAGLWDSRVVSTYEMADMPAGLFMRVRSPLSIVMDTTWTVAAVAGEGAADGQLELVEEIAIYCSRLLVGTVKGLCEGGWQQIHAKLLEKLTK